MGKCNLRREVDSIFAVAEGKPPTGQVVDGLEFENSRLRNELANARSVKSDPDQLELAKIQLEGLQRAVRDENARLAEMEKRLSDKESEIARKEQEVRDANKRTEEIADRFATYRGAVETLGEVYE